MAARVLHHLKDTQHFNQTSTSNGAGFDNGSANLMSPSSVTGGYNVTALSTSSPSEGPKSRQTPGSLWGVVIIALTLVLVLSGIASCCTRIIRWRRRRQEELERDLRGARRKDERMPGRLTTWAILQPTVAPQKSTHGAGAQPMQPRPAPVFLQQPAKTEPPIQLTSVQLSPATATIVEITIPPQQTTSLPLPTSTLHPLVSDTASENQPTPTTQSEDQPAPAILSEQQHSPATPSDDQLIQPIQPTTSSSQPSHTDTAITLTTSPVSDEDDNLCPICLEGYEGSDAIRVLPCTHYFHSECVDTWIDTQAMVCPLCRTDLRLLQAGSKREASSAGWFDRLLFRRWFSSTPALPPQAVAAAQAAAASVATGSRPAASSEPQQLPV